MNDMRIFNDVDSTLRTNTIIEEMVLCYDAAAKRMPSNENLTSLAVEISKELRCKDDEIHDVFTNVRASGETPTLNAVLKAYSKYIESRSFDVKSDVSGSFESFQMEGKELEAELRNEMYRFCIDHDQPKLFWNAAKKWEIFAKRGSDYMKLLNFLKANGFQFSEELKKRVNDWKVRKSLGRYGDESESMNYAEFVRRTGHTLFSQFTGTKMETILKRFTDVTENEIVIIPGESKYSMFVRYCEKKLEQIGKDEFKKILGFVGVQNITQIAEENEDAMKTVMLHLQQAAAEHKMKEKAA